MLTVVLFWSVEAIHVKSQTGQSHIVGGGLGAGTDVALSSSSNKCVCNQPLSRERQGKHAGRWHENMFQASGGSVNGA